MSIKPPFNKHKDLYDPAMNTEKNTCKNILLFISAVDNVMLVSK